MVLVLDNGYNFITYCNFKMRGFRFFRGITPFYMARQNGAFMNRTPNVRMVNWTTVTTISNRDLNWIRRYRGYLTNQ